MTRSLPRLLAVMGSGETAPTMVSVHAELLERLGAGSRAVLLDTPFGFQENAADICERTQTYFRQSVGHPIDIASFRSAETATPRELETMIARITDSAYIFAGPGSPTYALRQWRESPVPDLLRRKLREGGCVTFASAAAVSLGVCSLPVYEVYKVGDPPRWLDGLDLLGATGLRAALIPHYNNAEGGTHDTRYCYMGERRLRLLEEQLPEGVNVLGVDEHTACIFDLDAMTVSIRGRGGVTWRVRGSSRRFESGTVMPVDELRADAVSPGGTVEQREDEAPADLVAGLQSPFAEEVTRQRVKVDAALEQRDVDAVVDGLLALDASIHEWANDTLDSDERDLARASLRQYLVRLGAVAREGAIDPRQRLAPLVERLIALRRRQRAEGSYAVADQVRDALVDAGIEVRDTPAGTEWELREAPAQTLQV